MALLAITALAGMDLAQWQALLNNVAFAICLGAMLFYWGGAAFPQVRLLTELGLAGMIGANLTMAALLTARWIDAGYFPLSNLYESLFFLAWGITALHLVALYWSRSRWVGVMTAPVVTGIVAFAALVLPEDMQVAQPLVPALQSNWLMMHVTVMLLAYAALLVGDRDLGRSGIGRFGRCLGLAGLAGCCAPIDLEPSGRHLRSSSALL